MNETASGLEEARHQRLERTIVAQSLLARTAAIQEPQLRQQREQQYDELPQTTSRRSSLEDENRQLRDTLRQASSALCQIQSHADLKVKQLELQVLKYKQLYELERTQSPRWKVLLSHELKERRQQQQQDKNDSDNGTTETEPAFVCLNDLIRSKVLLTKENCKLQRQLRQLCPDCRTLDNHPRQAQQPRPTYQSSARHVLEQLPQRRPFVRPSLWGEENCNDRHTNNDKNKATTMEESC